MARVTRRPLAEADILEIWDYIAEDSIVEADHWMDRLDEKLRLWATQPMMGRSRDELATGLRSLAFGRRCRPTSKVSKRRMGGTHQKD